VNAGKSWLTGAFPEAWLYCLGTLFIAVTLFFPKGIAGALSIVRLRAAAPARAHAGEPVL
jgi:urea transport system permease protein